MSSASDNSTISSSGRSTPDHGSSGGGGSFTINDNNAFARRSSTPAQSFLAPRFWAHNSNAKSNEAGGFGSLPRRTSFGTTFSNGGRLSALSSFGMSPSNNPTMYGYPGTSKPPMQSSNSSPYPSQQQQNHLYHPPSTKSGSSEHRDLLPLSTGQQMAKMGTHNESAVATPDSTPTPSVPSSPVQKPRKKDFCYLPGPDGLCVESRGRRRSEE